MSMTPTTEEAKTKGRSLDLRDLHAANIARQAEWCPDQVPDLSFRGNELGGECGEAQNVIKKLERERQGWRGSRATKDDLADELADVVICADLCAVTAGIDLGEAVRRKFNATSEKQGLSVFLPSPTLASTPNGTEAVSTARLEAAMDAFYPGEDWREDLGIALPSSLRDMRAAIAASDAALASPRTDSAEGTAGTDRAWPASYQGTFDAIAAATKIQAGMISVSVRNFYRALSYPDRPSTPTPPAPPGVPDSVRALSEAATPGEWLSERNGAFCGLYSNDVTGSVIGRFNGFQYASRPAAEQDANAALAAFAVNRLREEIATHPAGRSEDDAERCIACDKPLKAGDRVLPDAEGGTIHAACCGPERESYTKGDGEPLGSNDPIPQGYVYEPEYPAGQSAGPGAEPRQMAEGCCSAVSPCSHQRRDPYSLCAVCQKANGLADKIQAAAPDSTRTGDEGAEWVRVPAKATREWAYAMAVARQGQSSTPRCEPTSEREIVWAADRINEALAARPAVPEAQGAERHPIETAPKDRSEILLFGRLARTSAKPSWFIGAWFPAGKHGEGWWVSSCFEVIAAEWAPLPAPPSSGQGGR